MKPTVGLTAAIAVALLSGCGGSSEPVGAATPRIEKLQRPAIQTQEVPMPCEWLPQAEVESILGKLARPPRRGFSAKSPRPDEEGYACVYSIAAARGKIDEVAVQLDLYGSSEFESAMGMLGAMFAAELNQGHGEAPQPEQRTDGWDYVSALPGISVWRLGHMAVQIGNESSTVAQETLERLALAIRNRWVDVPFAMPGSNANAPSSPPDPCALLTRAEAEAVLGKLLVEPYRSAESGAIADADGPSCSYYSQGHHALVLTPTWNDGATMFEMAGGIGGMLRSQVGGADEGDALDGPWDQATAGTTGALYFLKGDRMLEIVYKTSSTDVHGAARLAAAAIARL
jgi:hypothetical protein